MDFNRLLRVGVCTFLSGVWVQPSLALALAWLVCSTAFVLVCWLLVRGRRKIEDGALRLGDALQMLQGIQERLDRHPSHHGRYLIWRASVRELRQEAELHLWNNQGDKHGLLKKAADLVTQGKALEKEVARQNLVQILLHLIRIALHLPKQAVENLHRYAHPSPEESDRMSVLLPPRREENRFKFTISTPGNPYNHTYFKFLCVYGAGSEHGITGTCPLESKMPFYANQVVRFLNRRTAVSSSPSSLLGIQGMRGMGKTTLLRAVRDYYEFDRNFNHVVFFWIGAGSRCTVATLQHVISYHTGLPWPHMSDAPAQAISNRLKQTRFLLLLDDVEESIDLAAVGLPVPLGDGQKVIFTTRNHGICAKMGCTRDAVIQMEALGEAEAWNLFEDQVGKGIISTHPHIERLAEKMAAECRGLPSALCALGRAMSTKRDVKEWRYAYDVLKGMQPPDNEIHEMGDYSHLHCLEEALKEASL